MLTICVWPQCGDCHLFIIFHLIVRYFTKLKKKKNWKKEPNPDISKWLWSNKACESGVTCLWLLQCQEVKKTKRYSPHRREMPEYQVLRDRWSKQTHDHWVHCQENENKVNRDKKNQNRFIVVWPRGRYFLSFLATYLFSTFPEPPLTFEASPFSTARKFSGVTSCNNRHINPQSLLSAEKSLQTIVWKILKSVDLL